MNNKGFAITTILYGMLLIFLMLLLSMLKLLGTYRSNMEKLIEHNKGTREILTYSVNNVSSVNEISTRGLYCINNANCQYYK